ncbi:MAG: hypothetical protein GW808_08765 [Sphingomonadales bacterium]|nr:hypothetical protein [Sphingomonadales bacterium]PIX65501.1 MAG: hypothetical protein COZ43_09175 [Sphingomonadales bacterium CG_4_10_14_3_um_filter_58_15]NCO49244.1 hypothetical protein [Sphingomonadales bacterium]NCP01223.1 hypothetical protein [Sphingomonadales bacterium]NCP26647.1 hypothetical protein [Sphingomonadales bacterium]
MKFSFLYWVLTVAFAAATLPAFPAHANDQQNIFDLVEGAWTASGNSFGPDVKSEMIWSKTLDGQFYKIDYRIIIMDPATDKTFTGIGHYLDTDSNATVGYWADNSGDLHPLSVTIEQAAIISIWGVAGGKLGRTEYRLMDDGQIQVTDWLLTKEGWREFNRASFVRKP